MHQNTTQRPQPPEVRDTVARVTLILIGAVLLVDTVMIAYIFDVVHGAVQVLQQIGKAFN